MKCMMFCDITGSNKCCLSCDELENCNGICVHVKRDNSLSSSGSIGQYTLENVSKCNNFINKKED